MPVTSASTGAPAKDSVVVTWVPAGVAVNTHSWMPVMPSPVPPHRTRDWSLTAYTVEVTVKPKLVQVNDPPGVKAPVGWAAVISVCQAGQALTSWCSAQTRLTGAQDRRVVVDAGRGIHR
jgi:hypothetical protein